ncbi:hypothetical protein Cgig2_017596 [Carnegiea gigantea]|uniref:Uncharacterized protein n=1 Tax=Carnegiea gigantea TaxID=171969 RepID=A0A9Q1KNK9_9CARY|nr:hypothetical protein Cgig2_017596 [Carnegiea gigantea]
MALYRWIVEQLLTDYKANPYLLVQSMQQLCMERYELVAPQHKCRAAKRLMKAWACNAYNNQVFKQAIEAIKKESKPISDPMFWEDRACPSIGPPQVQVKRGRPQSERRRDISEGRKRFTQSSILKCSVCKQYGHNSRSYRKDGKLLILKGKDKPSYKSKRGCHKSCIHINNPRYLPSKEGQEKQSRHFNIATLPDQESQENYSFQMNISCANQAYVSFDPPQLDELCILSDTNINILD